MHLFCIRILCTYSVHVIIVLQNANQINQCLPVLPLNKTRGYFRELGITPRQSVYQK